MKRTHKQAIKVGTIKPSEIKSRDIVHMHEFLNGAGGYHKSKKDYSRKDSRRAEKGWSRQGSDPYALAPTCASVK